ncbi:MAG: PTS glucose transporter subunit IIA [Corynebacterium sp.]|nr:PTS glucose transporter subunit IIA [Corynebacterium sp.]
MSVVAAPLAGTVLDLKDVPDPVFAAGTVGDGVAIKPSESATPVTVLAPISGVALRVMPHAFVIAAPEGNVLVHVGIDTVRLRGEGYTVLATQGDVVKAGDPIVSFDPAVVKQAGYSPLCAVVLMDSKKGDIQQIGEGDITPGEELFKIVTHDLEHGTDVDD